MGPRELVLAGTVCRDWWELSRQNRFWSRHMRSVIRDMPEMKRVFETAAVACGNDGCIKAVFTKTLWAPNPLVYFPADVILRAHGRPDKVERVVLTRENTPDAALRITVERTSEPAQPAPRSALHFLLTPPPRIHFTPEEDRIRRETKTKKRKIAASSSSSNNYCIKTWAPDGDAPFPYKRIHLNCLVGPYWDAVYCRPRRFRDQRGSLCPANQVINKVLET